MAKQNRKPKGTGSIYVKNGSYVAQVQDGYRPNGLPKYRQIQRKSHAEAVKALNELQSKVTNGIVIQDGKGMSVEKWLDIWLETYVRPNAAPKTIDFYVLNVEKRLRPKLGRYDLRKLLPADVTKMFRLIEAEGATKSTVDATRRTLRAALGVAVKNGLCNQNAVKNAIAPKVERAERAHFTAQEIKLLLDKLKGSPIEGVVKFSLATGVRVGEATGLTWGCVDLKAKECRIESQLQRIEGKLQLKPLKTTKSRRVLPLVSDSLRVIQVEAARQKASNKPNELGIVFLNPEGRPLDPKYIDIRLKEALKKAELPATGMHSLRHSAATFMLMNGLNLHVVSRYLGHSQIALTSNLYGHVLNESMREAAETLQRAYTPQKKVKPVTAKILERSSLN